MRFTIPKTPPVVIKTIKQPILAKAESGSPDDLMPYSTQGLRFFATITPINELPPNVSHALLAGYSVT